MQEWRLPLVVGIDPPPVQSVARPLVENLAALLDSDDELSSWCESTTWYCFPGQADFYVIAIDIDAEDEPTGTQVGETVEPWRTTDALRRELSALLATKRPYLDAAGLSESGTVDGLDLKSSGRSALLNSLHEIRRMLRIHRPDQALPEEIELFGTVLEIYPRAISGELSWERNFNLPEELRREGPDHLDSSEGHDGQVRGNSSELPDRETQIEYLFMAGLCIAGAAGPERFPSLVSPYVPGGWVRSEEIVTLVRELTAARLTEWIDQRYKPWEFALTAAGLQRVEECIVRYTSAERTAELRKALLAWTYSYAKHPHSVGFEHFLRDPSSAVGGIVSTAIDVSRAARWLARRKYIGFYEVAPSPGNFPKGEITLLERGLYCVELYNGDPWVMSDSERRGDDRRTYTFNGDNVVVDSSNFTQVSNKQMVDVESLRDFAEAVLHQLPRLGVDADRVELAEQTATEIIELADQSEPSHSKLRALGRTLRAIVEGAAGNVLASVLLGMWHP
jgi:hypothetical protein